LSAAGCEEEEINMSRSNWLHNRRGEWYVVAQISLMLAVALAPNLGAHRSHQSGSCSDVTFAGGAMFCIIGSGFVVLGSVALGRNLSPFPAPKEGSRLVESGIFSIVRHPIYSGLSLLAFGWSSVCNSLPALVSALALLAFFDIKARREERWLEEKFSGYAAYKVRVKKLIPFLY
jgi:protein-S-isoprenylcysteine O-methyltransferase Ste14